MKKLEKRSMGLNGMVVIIFCFVLAVVIYKFLYGNPDNFQGGNPDGHPLPGNLLGLIYKGGIIVPVLQTLFLTVLALAVERFIALSKSKGKGNVQKFVIKIKELLGKNDIEGAVALCDKQKGSVANVVRTSLQTYVEVAEDPNMTKEEKQLALRKDIEEATMLELPSMQQNLPIIAAMTTLGTLVGLLGTVIGMIRSFAALSSTGGTDSVALSTGISEALVNTAFGIATGAFAVIFYNIFTTKIDGITHSIDEVGAYLAQAFTGRHK
jgi:biopolymer transport protein ExbB